MKALQAIVFLLLTLLACKKRDLAELDFFEVKMAAPRAESLQILRLQGIVEGLEAGVAEEVGFVWSKDAAALEVEPFAAAQVLAGVFLPFEKSRFSAVFTAFEAEETVFFRAFARWGKRKVFSKNIENFTLGRVVSLTTEAPRVSNDTAWVRGKLIGIEAMQLAVAAHGHVWSATEQLPEIGQAGCDSTNFFARNDDYVFESTLPGLDFHREYFVRVWAADAGGRIFYSKKIEKVVTGGGWKKTAATFPTPKLFDGTAVWDEKTGRAYAGFGCTEPACQADNLPKLFWSLDAAASGLSGVWSAGTDIPASMAFLRDNACSFVLGDTIYLVFGEEGQGGSLLADLWKYDLKSRQWRRGTQPSALTNRSGAVVFTLGGRAYAGSGGLANGFANDFWEYDPAAGGWRQVASLPLQLEPGGPVETQKGRREAMAFAVGGFGYVGGGDGGAPFLRDFWRFTPPAGPSDLGKWESAGFFPGAGRVDAVAFSVGGRGFCGLGHSALFNGPLRDWWEFDPARPEVWRRMKDFPGGERFRALGFPLGEGAWVGMGEEKLLAPGGNLFVPDFPNDFWLFVPEK